MATLTNFIVAATLVLAACGGSASAAETHDAHDATQVAEADQVKAPSAFDGMPKEGTRAYCPVMSAEFVVGKDTASSVYKGKTYVFCCPGCKPQFEADPEKYLK